MLVMQRVANEALVLVPEAEGAVVELENDGALTYACAAGSLTAHIGTRLGVEGSLSGLAFTQEAILRCDDADSDSRVDGEASRQVGAVSMICLPLVRSGKPLGVLKVISSQAGAFSDEHVEVLGRLGEFITWAIASVTDLAAVVPRLYERPDEAPIGLDDAVAMFVGNVLSPGLVTETEMRARLESIIARRAISMVFQPIVDLESGRLAGAEALARFQGPPDMPPDWWFREAARIGMGTDLELLAVGQALRLLDQLPDDVYLAINAGPDTVRQLAASGLLDGVDLSRVVIELTEHFEVDDYSALSGELFELRRHGVRVAIDDTGTGFSTFAHILRLAPDIIKLDRILTVGIDIDPIRRALAGALTTFAGETGATVVAEGIETEAELTTVRNLGIQFGQGYHLARPGPVDSVPTSWIPVPRTESADKGRVQRPDR